MNYLNHDNIEKRWEELEGWRATSAIAAALFLIAHVMVAISDRHCKD